MGKECGERRKGNEVKKGSREKELGAWGEDRKEITFPNGP
jgi:hypothetical protein